MPETSRVREPSNQASRVIRAVSEEMAIIDASVCAALVHARSWAWLERAQGDLVLQ